MSFRDRVIMRWGLPGIGLVFAFAGLTIYIVKHDSARIEPPVSTTVGTERQTAPLVIGA